MGFRGYIFLYTRSSPYFITNFFKHLFLIAQIHASELQSESFIKGALKKFEYAAEFSKTFSPRTIGLEKSLGAIKSSLPIFSNKTSSTISLNSGILFPLIAVTIRSSPMRSTNTLVFLVSAASMFPDAIKINKHGNNSVEKAGKITTELFNHSSSWQPRRDIFTNK